MGHPKPLLLALVRYPLIAKDLEDLPSQTPALFALPKAFEDVHTVH